MLLLPNCKINIGLNVVARREDGYHNLETVFYPIPLRDNLEIKIIEDEEVPYRLNLGGKPVEGDAKDNLVVKVYLALKEEFKLPAVDIFLYKNIPMGAGLGGGSSDAAAMMYGLNEMFNCLKLILLYINMKNIRYILNNFNLFLEELSNDIKLDKIIEK